MHPGHRNKSILGLGCWLGVFAGVIVLIARTDFFEGGIFSGAGAQAWVWLAIVAQTGFYFWGGLHLAKAKGQSPAMLLPGLFPCLQLLTLTVLLVLPDKQRQKSNPGRVSTERHRRESEAARIIRYRRNALVGNALGLFGIAVGVAVVLFPVGVFEDLENETLLGMAVFLCGYSGVITGCWWWAKAKCWPDGLVLIGLLPAAVLFIPYVRLVFLAAPGLLPVSMILMPLILLVILAVLPDKSGMTARRRQTHR